jgi:hypothetical protein
VSRDKEDWLNEIRRDNDVLMGIVTDIRAKKKHFLSSVKEVEKERLAWKSMEVDAVDSKVSKEIEQGLLSPQNRLLLPASLRIEAEATHMELEMLAMKVRANQLEVLQMCLTKVRCAEEAFVDKRADDLEGALDELRALTAATPCNVLTAKEMLKDLPGTVLKAIRDQEDKQEAAMVRSEAMEIVEPQDERQLRRQNQMLKSSLEQLRRKNAQLRNKLLRQRKDGGTGNTGGGGMDFSGRQIDSPSRWVKSASSSMATNAHDMAVVLASNEAWNAMDEDMRVVCMELIVAHMTKAVTGHPLASGAPAWLVKIGIDEGSVQMRDYVALYVEEQLAVARDVTHPNWLPSTVTAYFATASGHAQVMTEVMMILTYLNQRGRHMSMVVDGDRSTASNAAVVDENVEVNGQTGGNGGGGRSATTRAPVMARVRTPTIENESTGAGIDADTTGATADAGGDFTLDPHASHKPREKSVPRYMSNYKGRVSGVRGRTSASSN